MDSTEEPDPWNEKFYREQADGDFDSEEADSLYCPYCGVKIAHDFEYCPKCGKKLPFEINY